MKGLGWDPGVGRFIKEDDIKNDKHKLMSVGRLTRQCKAMKYYLDLAYNKMCGVEIPYDTLTILAGANQQQLKYPLPQKYQYFLSIPT